MQLLGIIAAIAGAACLVLLNFVWMSVYGRFIKRLEKNHPAEFQSLGSPVKLEDEPKYGSHGYVSYFWGRRYAKLGDSQLTALGDLALVLQLCMLMCVLVGAGGLTLATEIT